MKRLIAFAFFVSLSLGVPLGMACASHAPSSLSPAGVVVWQANQAAAALGTVQHLTIALNAVQVCDPAPCHPLVSDTNTRAVIDVVEVAVKTIHAVPSGWKATAIAALDQVEQKLDAAGKTKIVPFIVAAKLIIEQVVQ